jgi:hypothetical protein
MSHLLLLKKCFIEFMWFSKPQDAYKADDFISMNTVFDLYYSITFNLLLVCSVFLTYSLLNS